jgi:hypothetical protein
MYRKSSRRRQMQESHAVGRPGYGWPVMAGHSRSKNGVASLARSRSKNGVASLAYGPGHDDG